MRHKKPSKREKEKVQQREKREKPQLLFFHPYSYSSSRGGVKLWITSKSLILPGFPAFSIVNNLLTIVNNLALIHNFKSLKTEVKTL